MPILSYRQALYQSMDNALAASPAVVVMGQGVDDHKGTFGSTLGLARKYGNDRVFDIPLSEEGNTGIAIGAALNGVYPVQTHIRNDFALLAMNQLVNMAAKYKYMYGGVFEVPMLVRMVIGRSWGQGAQHSQSLQSLFAHIPGLAVIMPASADSVLTAYNYAVNSYRGPVISLEHRLLYEYMFNSSYNGKAGRKHLFGSKCVRAGTDLTIVATSVMVIEAQRAAAYLEEECRIRCEIIDLHSITHFDRELVLNSVSKTRHLLVADTSWQAYGVAAELARLICETDPSLLKRPMASLGMQPSPCPTAKKLENLFYPDGFRFVEKALDVLGKGGGEALRKEQFTDVYPLFRGPF